MRERPSAVFNFAPAVLLLPLLAALAPCASAQARGQSRPAAQRPTQREGALAPQGPRETEADAAADVSITARVTADSLRFEKVPNPRVEFTGRPRRDTAWEAERENLPPEVRPGVTYRDIGIRLHIRSVFADIDRIVAEALGEVPPGDDAPPAPSPQQPAPSPPAASNTPPAQPRAGDDAPARRRAPPRRGRGN